MINFEPSSDVVMLKAGLRCPILVSLALFLVSCSSIPSIGAGTRATSLEAAVATYRKMIRWGYYDEAVKYLRAKDGSGDGPDLARAARYRVTRYETGEQLLADNGREARVVAVIEYYELDSGVISTLRDEQYWWYDDADKHWYLGSPLPGFGL